MRKTVNISEKTLNRIKKHGKLGEKHEDVIIKALDCLDKTRGVD